MNPQLLQFFQNQMVEQAAATGGSESQNQMLALMQSLSEKQNTKKLVKRTVSRTQYVQLLKSRNLWKQYAAELSHTVRYFADMLGTCPVCFGNHDTCPQCSTGNADHLPNPDVNSLLSLVMPIFEQSGLEVIQHPNETIKPVKETLDD